jgi:hypothetical protein
MDEIPLAADWRSAFGSAPAFTVFAISRSAIASANASIELVLVPSPMVRWVNRPATCHSTTFANAYFAVAMVTASV